jgi:AcrR family transcriptional regulator
MTATGSPGGAKARILRTALALFNAEGVGALSAMDIAAALGISPGHLYYHFKGKPEIVAALASAHLEEVELVLAAALEACVGAGATLETLWAHVHILAEEAWDARFLYREAGGLALRYPDVGARIRRIAALEGRSIGAMLGAMIAAGTLEAGAEVLDALARLIVTAIAYHAIALELEGDPGPPRDRVARAVGQLMLLVSPFVTASRAA